MNRFSRRQFLDRVAVAGIATVSRSPAPSRPAESWEPTRRSAWVWPASGGRGDDHLAEFLKIPGVQVTHLIDPDRRLFDRRVKQIKTAGGNAPKCVQDVRKAIEDKQLDAISIATCNHWHSLITIWACQVGKDVYVEKPCSHKRVRRAPVRGSSTQVPADRATRHPATRRQRVAIGLAISRQGKFGRLLVARGRSYRVRKSIGLKQPTTPPPEVGLRHLALALLPGSLTMRTWSITTGIGFGTPATGTSATTAYTTPTPRDG